MQYLYILKSVGRHRTYIGCTYNIDKRVREHNTGSVRSTKGYRPFWLVYVEVFSTKREARRRELRLKHHSKTKADLFSSLGIL